MFPIKLNCVSTLQVDFQVVDAPSLIHCTFASLTSAQETTKGCCNNTSYGCSALEH